MDRHPVDRHPVDRHPVARHPVARHPVARHPVQSDSFPSSKAMVKKPSRWNKNNDSCQKSPLRLDCNEHNAFLSPIPHLFFGFHVARRSIAEQRRSSGNRG